MAERPQGYGMTAEIRTKLDAKHDPVREAQASDWLEAVVGEPFPNGSFEEALKDGVYLCKAINVLDPNKNIKINTSKMAFKQAVSGIHALGRKAQAIGYTGPTLGPKESDESKREFTEEELHEGRNIIVLQMGSNFGASQAGSIAYGRGRQID